MQILVLGVLEHVVVRLAAAHQDHGRDVLQGGDGRDVLMGLHRDPYLAGTGVAHHITQEVGGIGPGDFHVQIGLVQALQVQFFDDFLDCHITCLLCFPC